MRGRPSIVMCVLLLGAMCALLWPAENWIAAAWRDPGAGFTAANVLGALGLGRVFAAVFETAALVTLACIGVGTPLAYGLARLPRGWAGAAIVLLLIQFGLWLMLDRAANWWTMWPMFLGFMLLPLVREMRAIAPTELRAAASLGASLPRRLRHVILPLTMPGLAAGAALVFVISAGLAIRPALGVAPNPAMAAAFAVVFVLLTGAVIAIGAMLLPRAPVRVMETD